MMPARISEDKESDIEAMLEAPPTFSQWRPSSSQQVPSSQKSTETPKKERTMNEQESIEEKVRDCGANCNVHACSCVVLVLLTIETARGVSSIIAQRSAKFLPLTIANDVESVQELFWHRQSKKKEPLPVRLCKDDEAVGLIEGKWNPSTKVLVQYLGECSPNQRMPVFKKPTDTISWLWRCKRVVSGTCKAVYQGTQE
jgi:hypothetical protein